MTEERHDHAADDAGRADVEVLGLRGTAHLGDGSVPVRTGASVDDRLIIMDELAYVEERLARPSLVVVLAKWLIIAIVASAVIWTAYNFTSQAMKAPERERRVEACVVAMMHSNGGGPLEACEKLDEDAQKQASYEYLKRVGWL